MEDEDEDEILGPDDPSSDQYSPSLQVPAKDQDFKTFTNFVSKVMVLPYGVRMYDTIHELAMELELADSLISDLN